MKNSTGGRSCHFGGRSGQGEAPDEEHFWREIYKQLDTGADFWCDVTGMHVCALHVSEVMLPLLWPQPMRSRQPQWR